ncbi:probable G-protein coupled receptor 149 [Sardina pilchardus]|uniref:probable G-protein coupled receptor 149 n=1 Tax=Sardina pilchardus TaxID=27697 RepID=UPI002E11A906
MVTRSSSTTTDRLRMDREHPRYSPVFFAQKRFSVILAIARIVLWMPMMTQIVVSHIVHVRSTSMETLSFFLTFLSAAVTPMFVLSEHWIHLPCGCFINCRSGAANEASVNKRRFDFNMSFQNGYGFYKISHSKSPSIEKPSYSNFFHCNLTESRVAVLDSGQIKTLANNEFRTTANEDSSLRREVLLDTTLSHEEELAIQSHNPDHEGLCLGSPPPSLSGEVDVNLDTSSVFDGSERRLSHEECRKIELTDWEWCRSKSERTPRQRSTGGLSIPLCAFQGTVSLQAPTGKTLSLSTYEVSSDGLKISPTTKKVEVYRSKSVGHEPSADEPHSNSSGSGGGEGVGGVSLITGIGDTNVKIHLEVLEICDNEEAMDSVSIISNISQSSTHARSPSLRYSRRENRFVSCDLGETASYSLLIPAINPDADNINIHIPDTVEAHRQNSMRQSQESGGYREEIQLLNEVYRKANSQRN